MKTKVTISYPTNTPGIAQFIDAGKLTVAFQDGSTWTLDFLLTELIKLINKDSPNDPA